MLRRNIALSKARYAAFGLAGLLLPLAAHAQFVPSFGLPTVDLGTMVSAIIKNFLALLGVFLVLQIMYGGFLYMTHGGNEENKKKAVGTIKSSIIGFVIIMLAPSLATFVLEAISRASQSRL